MSRTVPTVDPLMLLRVEGLWPPMQGNSAPFEDTSTTIECPSALSEPSSVFESVMDAGFDGVEMVLSGVGAGGTTESETESSTGPAVGRMGLATQAAVAESRIGAVSAICPTIDPREALRATAALVAQTEAFGARCLNLRIAPLAGFEVSDGFGSYQDAVNFVHVLLAEIRPVVESAGVVLAIEAGRGGVLLSPVEMRDLIDGANSPALGVCLDVPTLTRVGSPLDWIETLQGLVHAVRVVGDADTCPERVSLNRAGATATQFAVSLREHGFGGVWIVAAAGGETITTSSPASRIAHQVRDALNSNVA